MQENLLRYYSRNQIFLSQMGIWPYQHRMIKILLPCFLVIAEASVFGTQILLLHNTWGDMSMAVEGIVNMILLTGATTKLLNIAINNNKLQYLLQLMDRHWRLFHSECELHILRYYANIAQKLTNYYSVYINIFVAMFMSIPLMPKILDVIIPLNESRPSIYVIAGDWGVDKEKYYYPILLHSYLAVVVTIRIMVHVDTMYMVCVLHGCSLFNAIGIRLENIFDKTKFMKGQTAMNKEYLVIEGHEDYCEMIACLKKHQLAIKYTRLLDSTFRSATFLILFLNVLILSLIGLQLINKLGQTQEVIRFGCIAVGSVTHLLSICLPGQLLLDRSIDVFDKAYSAQWYMFSLKTRKLLSILLYRSLVPCTLSAANMYVMSMTTFSSVMQTAMSYFTTFLSVN
ncbi:Odorant receptor [Camponotus japonicus]